MLSRALSIASTLIDTVNKPLKAFQPTTYLASTASIMMLTAEEYLPMTYVTSAIAASLLLRDTLEIYRLWDKKKVKDNIIGGALKMALNTPFVGPMVDKIVRKETLKILDPVKQETDKLRNAMPIPAISELPKKGEDPTIIFKSFENLHSHYVKGSLSGAVYAEHPPELENLLKEVVAKVGHINPLHASWPEIQRMEAEVISMCAKLFNGEEGTYGLMTHGGTSSIIEAMTAYIRFAREVRGIETPEIIVPDTIHVAFDKIINSMGARVIRVPTNAEGIADVKATENAISKNTCAIVGSAPSFSYGRIDNIKELAAMAQKHDIPFHLDACLGGFETPFARKLGYDIPLCDFTFPGVTTISADLHKFGEGYKGASVLLVRPPKNLLAPHTTQSFLTWVGGAYVTPGLIDGSRSAIPIATSYAVLRYFGEEGYCNHVDAILKRTKALETAIKDIDGIVLPYKTDLSVIGIRTKPGIDPMLVAEILEEGIPDDSKADSKQELTDEKKEKIKRWSVIRLLNPKDSTPEGFHFCLTYAHTLRENFVEDFARDLAEAVDYVKKHPERKAKGIAKAYGLLATGYIPTVVQNVIGNVYHRIGNALPGVPISGFWDRFGKPVIDIAKKSVTTQPAEALAKKRM